MKASLFYRIAAVLLAVFAVAHTLGFRESGPRAETLTLMRGTTWAFALCFAAITIVSWRYLFILPIVFALMITACLISAAWLSSR